MINLQTDHDKQMALNCLKISMNEDFFPDWEFSALFGLTKDEVKNIIENWRSVDLSNEDVQLAINNAFANLIGYPHGQEKNLRDLLSISTVELEEIYNRVKV